MNNYSEWKRVGRMIWILMILNQFVFWADQSFAQTEVERYAFTGEIVGKNSDRMTVLVRHEAVDPILQAGKTAFVVSPGDLAWLDTGDKINAEGFVYGSGYRLECVWPRDEGDVRTMTMINGELRQDTIARGRGVFRGVGEFMPPFALWNQYGKLVQNKTVKGRFIVMNFIFTRCQNPRMCPASTARMQKLQDALVSAGIDNVQLLSVSFDPEYDSPGILRQYADARGIDGTNFSFLTGPKDAVNDLLKQTGIITEQANGTIDHSMATLLIDDKGKIIYRKEGSSWQVVDFLERLQFVTAEGER